MSLLQELSSGQSAVECSEVESKRNNTDAGFGLGIYFLPLNLQPTIGSRDSVQYSTVYGAAVEKEA